MLGVTIANSLSVSEHIIGPSSARVCAQTIYALKVLRAHDMDVAYSSRRCTPFRYSAALLIHG